MFNRISMGTYEIRASGINSTHLHYFLRIKLCKNIHACIILAILLCLNTVSCYFWLYKSYLIIPQ